MTAYAVAHIRQLTIGPPIEEYTRRIDATLEPFGGRFLVHGGRTEMGHRFETPTLAETMLQVASHSTYHRGQVNARLREVGGEPTLVDYIAWIWFGRPAADWNAALAPSRQAVNT